VPEACTGSNTAGGVNDDTSIDCATTTIKDSNVSTITADIFENTILIEDGVGCYDTSNASISTLTQDDGATYCAEGYEGSCKYTYCHSNRTLLDNA
jgi:hypothetical protein